MKVIKYKSGYKYQTALQHKTMISITGHDAESEFVSLSPEGLLLIRSGYAWDGPTGYVLHTYRQRMMRGSLYHDALYQLMREGVLGRDHRQDADDVFLTNDTRRQDTSCPGTHRLQADPPIRQQVHVADPKKDYSLCTEGNEA